MKEKEKWIDVRKNLTSKLNGKNLDCGRLELGPYWTESICLDINHLLFGLSRYKFVSKLVKYRKDLQILELGCNEAIGSFLFVQNNSVRDYTGIDFDPLSTEWNRYNMPGNCMFYEDDFFDCKAIDGKTYDLVFSLDVIEHIDQAREKEFCCLMHNHIKKDGVAVVGTPSVMMTPYASEASRIGHVNLYSQDRLYDLMSQFFSNVFIFNMNDEVVHTGFAPMACYFFAVCSGKRDK